MLGQAKRAGGLRPLQSNNSSSREPQLQKSPADFVSGLILPFAAWNPSLWVHSKANHHTGATQPHKQQL